MLKLCNFSNYITDLERVNSSAAELEKFLHQHQMDGIELLICQPWDSVVIPSSLVKGIHLPYYSVWLDFWQGNKAALLKQFGNEKKIREYYGCDKKDILVQNYRQQILDAEKIGAEYVVFHISHTEIEHLFDHQFICSDEEVVKASIELINEIFFSLDTKITLLLENLWLRGLTFLQPNLVERLLTDINYAHKGFMLDTGHLMNTNPLLTTEAEGIAYILQVLTNLGESKRYIQGIHLHKSLSGPYVLANRNILVEKEKTMDYIFNIDQHEPFDNPAVQRIIEAVEPTYLTYEFITRTKKQWSQYLSRQNKALGF